MKLHGLKPVVISSFTPPTAGFITFRHFIPAPHIAGRGFHGEVIKRPDLLRSGERFDRVVDQTLRSAMPARSV